MALFALMLLVHQASSIAEEQQEEKRVETAMHQMAKDLESGRRISAKQSQDIVKQFEHLGEYIKKEASSKRGINLINGKPGQDQATGSPGQKVFNIKPAKNALIRFSYSKPQGHQDLENSNGKRRPSVSASSATSKRRQQPKYFLNFNFKNHRRSKTDVDQPSTTVQPRTGRARQKRLRNGMPNPFKFFPLKGENI
ncbi:GL13449 [Drosophila persimilis]|uniref:GL13449 n=1 Tax=Drosophila persimilis TaxID=7234 RepID=B4GNP0_DROPE|nr:GL13449 [Drosophila persimilis]